MLTPEQISQYHRDGYLVVPGLLTAPEVDAFVAYEQEPKPEGWRKNLRNHTRDAAWQKLATHPNVTSGVAQLLDGAPMVVQTMYLEKKPAGDQAVGGTGVAMHQDAHYLPNEPNTLMACWIAMGDTDPENGGLCIVPGSHKGPLHRTHKARDASEHDSWEVTYQMRDQTGREWVEHMYSFEIEGLDTGSIRALTVPKGGGVFFTGMTIHGSFGNRSRDRVRRAFAIHYCREGTWMFRTDVQMVTPAL